MFQFLRLSTKFLAVSRLSVSGIYAKYSGMVAEYFVFKLSIFNIQTSIFNIQTSIFRLPYLSYFHYLNNYESANGGNRFAVNI